MKNFSSLISCSALLLSINFSPGYSQCNTLPSGKTSSSECNVAPTAIHLNEQDILEQLKWVNLESISLAIKDMESLNGFNSKAVQKDFNYLTENLEKVRAQLAQGSPTQELLKKANDLIACKQRILLKNPLLDFDRILVTKFHLGPQARTVTTNKMCMPMANYMGLIDVPATGYDAELCMLSNLSAADVKQKTIYKPTKGEGIADVQLHWDADRLLFAMARPVVIDDFYNQEYPSWHIFEIGIDGDSLKHISRLPEPDLEFGDPCYLPDGRILFTTNIGYNGIPCEHGERVIMNLAIYDPRTGAMRKLTFDQDGNWSPTVLNNGRIMYTRWEYTDLTHYFTRIIMHSNPDGTECKALYGSGSFWPTSVYDMQQLPNGTNQFIGTVSGHHGTPRAGKLIVFDPSKGRKEADGVIQEIPFRNREVIPEMKDRLVDGVYPQFSRPYPVNEKYFVVTAKPHANALWGIYLVDVFDNMTLIAESEGDGYLTPIPVKKRPVPPVIPDRIVEGEKNATVFIQDIYTGEGLRDVPRGTVKKFRLFTYEYAYLKSPSDFDALGVQSGWDLKRELGTVPVEADGSAIFTVPANMPISIQPLDENDNAIQWMRSWFTAMPGEVVSCVGCHEDHNIIPIPKRVIASQKKPSTITVPEGGVRPFSFELEIQPILNRNCAGCHDGEKQFDLGDSKQTEYKRWGNYTTHRMINDSYYNLHPYVYRQGPEADLYVLQPYEYHASNSELMQMLDKGHQNVTLTPEERTTLCKWIDFNAPYFGDFEIAGRYKATFEQYPRRIGLMQKYANVSADWKKELSDYARYLAEQEDNDTKVAAKPTKVQKTNRKKTEGWGFSPEQAQSMQAKLSGEKIKTVEIAPNVQMKFVWIPDGKFFAGEDQGGKQAVNHKEVMIPNGFWMGTLEVSNEQYTALVPEHDSRYIGQQWKDHTTPGYAANEPQQPVVRVTWEKAMEYCRLLSEKTGLNMTLPTAQEWEWACRAGSTKAMWYGDADKEYSSFENMADFNIKDLAVWGLEPTVPIPDNQTHVRKFWDFVPRDTESNDGNLIAVKGGSYQANPWGLHDMHGNVAEWTATDFEGDGVYAGSKIVKGGSWRDRAEKSTAWNERMFKPWQAPFNVGFRVIIKE